MDGAGRERDNLFKKGTSSKATWLPYPLGSNNDYMKYMLLFISPFHRFIFETWRLLLQSEVTVLIARGKNRCVKPITF